jgi:hypothetical protein
MGVSQLMPVEQVVLDQGRLGELYRQFGEDQAEEVLCRALEDLGGRLDRCERLYRAGDWAALVGATRAVIVISEQLGLRVLADVAAHVCVCLEAGDANAVSATFARLLRVGEGSLCAVCERPLPAL